MSTSQIRIRRTNGSAERPDGQYVLYWMIAQRRTRWNFALQRAAERSRALGVPLLVLEPLRCDYPWASDRIHGFVLEGMRANERRFAKAGIAYYPYVERTRGAGKGLLEALASKACLVVTDEWPSLFLPRMVSSAAARLKVRMEAVDGCGLLPLGESEAEFKTAHSFRRFLQKRLLPHLLDPPVSDPLRGVASMPLPPDCTRRWSPEIPMDLSTLPIDHTVAPCAPAGGEEEGRRAWRRFLGERLARYGEDRNRPEIMGTSGLSPYLHFGHLSPHELFADLAAQEEWSPDRVSPDTSGKRAGWWGMSEAAEAWLDQLVTWRELGFHFCVHRADCDRFDSLPAWALATLRKHASDPRTPSYTGERMEAAATEDRIWNAAQNQLKREGTIHNYLRMLWGKKILEWSRTPEEALSHMIDWNNRYALDGRDPNSLSGIFWVLGRFDRAWGPERPIFGTVRYMSSANTARKYRLKSYLERHAD